MKDAQSHSGIPDIAVIGAGIIGLSCAWELARLGSKVVVHEKKWPPSGASWAAAGMLAPAYEAATEKQAHPGQFELCKRSLDLWPGFGAGLQEATGIDIGYRGGPSIALFDQASGSSGLQRFIDRLSSYDVPFDILRGVDLQVTEPVIASENAEAVILDIDGQVDNRAVMKALIEACKRDGVLFESGQCPAAGVTVRTTGWESPYCEPVKGQLLSLRPGHRRPAHVIRSGDLYIVPKSDRIVIGATVEPGKSDGAVSTAATDDLLRRAIDVCPGLEGSDVLERWCGIRPCTEDGAPLLAEGGPGCFVATGHHRNGVLLAPVTASIMAEMILEGRVSDLAAAFSPERFASVV